MTITWSQTGVSKVSLALYRNDMFYGWIMKDIISGDGKQAHMWVPNNVMPIPAGEGAVYKIYVTGTKTDGSGYVDDKSDAPFSFGSSPTGDTTVQVTAPNGGETYTIGTTHNSGDSMSNKVVVHNAKTKGDISVYITERNTDSWQQGKYHWLRTGSGFDPAVTNPIVDIGGAQINNSYTPGQYYLLAEWRGTDGVYRKDFSDKPFTLKSSTPTTCPEGYVLTNGQCVPVLLSCTLTSNKSSYAFGETITFSWTSSGATYAVWPPNTSGKDSLPLPGDKLPANGSQQVTASVTGNPSVTLAVYNASGQSATCTKTVSVASPVTSLPIIFSKPAGGETFTLGSTMTVRWSATAAAGLELENVSTKQRTFWRDALWANADHTLTIPGGLATGQYRVIGYSYNEGGRGGDVGASNAFTLSQALGQQFWVRPNDAAAICRHFAGTNGFSVLETRDARCEGSRCVSPKFVWLLGTTVIEEDRPSYLPADGKLQKIACIPEFEAAQANAPQLAAALTALESILKQMLELLK
jgi:hypothetical protein